MSIIEMLCIAFSLASDAFAVSLCKGMSIVSIKVKDCLKIAIYFSGFQMLMPLIGFSIGIKCAFLFFKYSKILVFILLGLISLKMISESREEGISNSNLDIKEMIVLSIATSIDALAVGISFALLKEHILLPIIVIGIVTFVMCFCGSYVGNRIGNKYKGKAELLGGIILLLIAFKIIITN